MKAAGPTAHALEVAKVDTYFDRILARYPVRQPIGLFVVTHLLADRPHLLRALAEQAEVKVVLPKPKSVDERVLQEVSRSHACDPLSRERFRDPTTALEYLERRAAGQSVILLDVGGYFAPTLREMSFAFSGRIVGVVEDTENGHRRYLSLRDLPCPVYSVARSPLKDPEDCLVGQSIVFSTEALLRSQGDVLHGRDACVIGFGKIGSSIASMFHARNVRVTVYDENPVRMTQALARGFRTARNSADAVRNASVVVCATGNVSLRGDDFSFLQNGAYVASVTSSDDEMELDGLRNMYDHLVVERHLHRYSAAGRYFYLLNDGNALNFLHGAVIGPVIFLVQAEILAAVSLLSQGRGSRGLCEVGADDRALIAQTWLDQFNG